MSQQGVYIRDGRFVFLYEYEAPICSTVVPRLTSTTFNDESAYRCGFCDHFCDRIAMLTMGNFPHSPVFPQRSGGSFEAPSFSWGKMPVVASEGSFRRVLPKPPPAFPFGRGIFPNLSGSPAAQLGENVGGGRWPGKDPEATAGH